MMINTLTFVIFRLLPEEICECDINIYLGVHIQAIFVVLLLLSVILRIVNQLIIINN